MKNSIRAEITIHLVENVEKTEKTIAHNRLYKFSIPVGAPFDTAIHYAKEMVKQVEAMKEEADKQKEEVEKEENKENKKEEEIEKK